MTVYIVTLDDRPAPGVQIRGVFSTAMKAVSYIEDYPAAWGHTSVVSYVVDEGEE